MAGNLGGNDKEKFSLNLYPMIDIFSILICFLLMNFSTQGESVESKAGLELPRSEVKVSLDTAATVSISQKEIVVQGELQIPILANGDVAEAELLQGGLKRAYEIFKKLRDQHKTLKNVTEMQVSENDLNILTLEADKKTKFQLLKRVMLTAQQADFISWKLATEKNDID